MMTIDQVEQLRQTLIQEGTPAPDIIRQLAEACLGWPYVFGAWGEECTPGGRRRRARSDHPTIVSSCPALNGSGCGACKWGQGVRMFDCRGFTAWLIRAVGLDIQGDGATSQYNHAANWVRRGKIAEMPDVVCCVFRQKGGRMEHTGMHVGGGEIIHCSRGVERGSVTKVWTHYAIPAGLYSEEEIPMSTVRPMLRKGCKGDLVSDLQETLNRLGYDCGYADGVYGARTKAAVIAFQTAEGLTADGICGPLTWAALDKAEAAGPIAPADPTTYRVTIEGVTWEQYLKILEICPLAEAAKEA